MAACKENSNLFFSSSHEKTVQENNYRTKCEKTKSFLSNILQSNSSHSYVRLDVLLAMFSYCMFTPLVTIANKHLFSHMLGMPVTISCMQQVAVFLLIFSLGNLSAYFPAPPSPLAGSSAPSSSSSTSSPSSSSSSCALLATFLHYIGPVRISYRILRETLVISILFVCMISFSNLCLKNVMLSSYQVARSSSLLFNVVLSSLILHQRVSNRIIFSCFLVGFGFMISTSDPHTLSLQGASMGAFSSLAGALYMVMCKQTLLKLKQIIAEENELSEKRKKKEENKNKNDIKNTNNNNSDSNNKCADKQGNVETVLVVHVAINSVFLFLPVICLAGELDVYNICISVYNFFTNIMYSPSSSFMGVIGTSGGGGGILVHMLEVVRTNARALCLIVFTGFLAALIPYTTYICLKITTPLTCTIVGFFKTCIQTLGGLLIFRDTLNIRGALGLFLCLFGIFYYSYAMYIEKESGGGGGGTREREKESNRKEECNESNEKKTY